MTEAICLTYIVSTSKYPIVPQLYPAKKTTDLMNSINAILNAAIRGKRSDVLLIFAQKSIGAKYDDAPMRIRMLTPIV